LQVDFIDYVIMPMFTLLDGALFGVSDYIARLRANRGVYKSGQTGAAFSAGGAP
jgi:hypothetical protein